MRKLFMVISSMLFMIVCYSQTINVQGKITDVSGSPLSGATIKQKNTKTTIAADNQGNFALKTTASAILIVSQVGYESVEVVATTERMHIQLREDVKSLSEVVVTGVGVATSKKRIAISVESVSTDKTTAVPSASVDQFLIGKIAGAQITSANGNPGQPVNILLRGINTLNRGTSPMILLDGIEVRATELNAIDLNSIEKVEIVQGAASATIYGAQGANGVIQLFSKKGKQGKINIDVSSSMASSELLNVGNVRKGNFHSYRTNNNNEVVGSSGTPILFDAASGSYTSNVIVNLVDINSVANKPYDKNFSYYDHYGMFFKAAKTYNNSISIYGGKEKVDFNVTVSDNRQTSNFRENGTYARSNLSANIGIELFKNLKFRTLTQLTYTKNQLLDPTGRTIMYAINNARPFANFEYKNASGLYSAYLGDAVGVNHYNPLYISQYADFGSNKVDIIQNFSLNYKLPRFLELDAKYGLNYQIQEDINNIYDQSNNDNADYWAYWLEGTQGYHPRTTYGAPSAKEQTGEIDHFRFNTTFQNFITTANIRTDFQNDFNINIPLRTTTQIAFDYRKEKFNQYITYGIDAPNYTPYTSSQMGAYKIESDLTTPALTYGYLVNQRFEWGDLAGVSAGFRRDWSSAFGQGQTPKTFPRADAYFNLSSIGIWNKGSISRTLPTLKLRAAYGQAGIQPRPFDRYITFNTNNMGNNVAFSLPTQNPNPSLDVEISKETEIGTDMSFNFLNGNWLQNAELSFTFWNRKTVNAIWDVDVAPSTGTGTVKDNAFSLASNGIQASLKINALRTKNLTWNLTSLFSKQSSKITDVIGSPVVVISAAGSSNYILRAGEKIGQLYGYRMIRAVDEVDETGKLYIPKDEQISYTVASTGYVVSKATRQPFFSADKYSFGDPNPNFNMSFINDLSFRNYLFFSMQWDWVNRSHLYNQTKEWMYRDGIHGDYDAPVTIDGQSAAYTAYYRGIYAQRQANGTKNYFYEDASFLRLRNISLAFDIAKVVKLPAFQRLQLVLSGRNLITLTKYTGFDPEISSGANNSAFDRGVDHNTIPNLRSYQIALNVGF